MTQNSCTAPSVLTIEQQKTIAITAVDGVVSFSSNQIVLTGVSGRIVITGENLKITGFSKSNGTFAGTGTVTAVKFQAPGFKLKNRLLK